MLLQEGEDCFQFALHPLSQQEGIQLFKLLGEGTFDRLGDLRRFQNPLIRGLGRIMAFDGLGADAFFGNQLH